ncbi:hypothetical protein CBM2633_P350008 [Cupriavidus taiwanensis]|uniref:Uncharacterized protein n=2 Tax=Cupriavidus TaxID=106589 RepID=A0A375CPH5_9BURK|nr:hypothetical protein CBM2585_P350004 [Cupriavidus taiwanensis]SOZ40646.1 hypothetical protein CBM2605_P350007 [Cupriavidus neocaledonicus]SOY75952.1 hypothetical protein CBM2588_P390004 [Cupriavidus taiwanensis]SOY75985.1 hypothetical protein CBM2592_P380007 [Cupriavidus taiwanensis]SOY76775.1 hypothetical protein CBM2589_P350007 [Cupriavidus taiwanensis]
MVGAAVAAHAAVSAIKRTAQKKNQGTSGAEH